MLDSFNRQISYLRISVTDRCNFRCLYCMPDEGILLNPAEEILTFEEIEKIVSIFIFFGIRKVRISGGEPLVRKDLTELIRKISIHKEIEDLAITTNGYFLKDYLLKLIKAGLKRVNISLDTLNKEKFIYLTHKDGLKNVLAGIDAALEFGLNPVKINCVLIKGINDDEVIDFVKLTIDRPLKVRFIELMPTSSFNAFGFSTIFADELITKIKNEGFVFEDRFEEKYTTSKTYKIKNALGEIGFITPLSQKFCHNCNRLRLSSDGFLYPCLYSTTKLNIKGLLRGQFADEKIIEEIKNAVLLKPEDSRLTKNNSQERKVLMYALGG